jgi:hypothetical protein
MAYYIYAASYKIFLDSGAAVLRRQILASNSIISLAFSGFMVLSRQLGTEKKTFKTMANHDDVRDLEVGALEIGPSSQLAIVRWITIQNVYSHLVLVFFRVPRCLELTEV